MDGDENSTSLNKCQGLDFCWAYTPIGSSLACSRTDLEWLWSGPYPTQIHSLLILVPTNKERKRQGFLRFTLLLLTQKEGRGDIKQRWWWVGMVSPLSATTFVAIDDDGQWWCCNVRAVDGLRWGWARFGIGSEGLGLENVRLGLVLLEDGGMEWGMGFRQCIGFGRLW